MNHIWKHCPLNFVWSVRGVLTLYNQHDQDVVESVMIVETRKFLFKVNACMAQ